VVHLGCLLLLNFYVTKLRENAYQKLPQDKKKGKFNGGAPSKGYNSASGALFCMKLSEDIEQKLRKTMLALFDHQSGFTQVTRIKRLFLAKLKKTIVTKQHFSRKE